VIGLVSGVVDCGQNVFALKKRIILEDFIEGCPCAEQLQYIADADALAVNAGTASALAFLNGDSTEALQIHKCPHIQSTLDCA
jgi:hypothetical protein